MKTSTFSKALWCLMLISAFIFNPQEGDSQKLEKEHLDQLKFRHIGPIGNRINSVSGVPGDPLTYVVGAASGGVWKTVDGGLNWMPIFDKQDVHAIGSLTICPSDPQIIYVGTGESFIRSNVSIGNGMYKSTDGGETWAHIGLENTGRISRVIVHPENPDIVYVAALGHAYSPQPERGVYRSMDGGTTWEHVLFVDENTGASDIVMDPDNPRILFAGTWQLELKTWKRNSGGPGSGVHMSTDAGKTWKKLQGNGLPKGPVGKVALAMTPAKPDRVYALIETGDGVPLELEGQPTETGELWRSDNNGKTFQLVSSNRDLGGRGAYYTRCAASPDNPHEVYFMAAGFVTSIDGGKSVHPPASPFSAPNWDHHEMWIDPTNGDRMVVVGDGGVSISQNRGVSWLRNFLPVAQLYHITTDNNIPYNVLTNRQDGPSMKGPSNSRTAGIFGPGMIQSGMWRDVGGGESGFATPDPTDPDIVWSSASGYGPLGGIVTRYNENNKQYRQVEVWPELAAGTPAKDLKYRFQWTFPLLISPHDNNTIYVTSQHVHRTTNGGQTWEEISPDLTLNEKDKQGFSGGLTGDNIAVEYFNVIYAFDESPVQEGVFWAGTNDGLVHVSQDGGTTWTNVTDNIPDLPEYGVVRNIDASKWDAGKAYLTVEFHQVGNFDPYVYKTENYGRSWTKITNGIKEGNLSYTRCVREDPVTPGLLYLGTENALYASWDDGANWQSLMTNLPPTPYYWIDIPEHFNDLVLGTYGRGVWILDDITALQQMTKEIQESSAHLFKPRPVYRFQPVTMPMQFFPEASTGVNPTYGASIHYWMKDVSDTVKVSMVITNEAGDTIRTLPQKPKKGLNKIHWDLKGEPTTQILMRTAPKYAEWIPLGKDRTRKPTVVPFSTLMPPGKYMVHLSAGDQSFSEELEVIKDPHSEGTMEDVMAQHNMMEGLHADMNTVSDAINEMEMVRRQLIDLKAMLKTAEKDNDIIMAVDSLHGEVAMIEDQLIQRMHTGTGQDAVRFPAKIAGKLGYLATTVPVADFSPADSHIEVHNVLKERMNQVMTDYQSLKDGYMKEVMEMLSNEGLSGIITN
jgi:photosystem II stability/assembly factor-like uncharacterized protein